MDIRQGLSSKLWIYWLVFSMVILFGPFFYSVADRPLQMVVEGGWKWPWLESPGLYWMHHALAGIPVLFFGGILNLFGYRKIFLDRLFKPMLWIVPLYLAWDVVFTHYGVWGFNSRYVTGLRVIGLPVEEWLWFFIIPFCSLFLYHIVDKQLGVSPISDRWLQIAIMGPLGILYVWNIDQLYTAVSAGSVLVVLAGSLVLRHKGFAKFLMAFGIILIPMVLFNSMLTGFFTEQALVAYNPEEFSGIRILSFPLEDIGFGFSYLYGIICLSDQRN